MCNYKVICGNTHAQNMINSQILDYARKDATVRIFVTPYLFNVALLNCIQKCMKKYVAEIDSMKLTCNLLHEIIPKQTNTTITCVFLVHFRYKSIIPNILFLLSPWLIFSDRHILLKI